MKIKEAVVCRVRQLCKEKGMNPNTLAVSAGVTPSTVYSMLDGNRKDLSIITLKKIIDGLDVTLGEFFSTPEFDSLEQEIE